MQELEDVGSLKKFFCLCFLFFIYIFAIHFGATSGSEMTLLKPRIFL